MTTTTAEPPQSILQSVPQGDTLISPLPGDSLPANVPDSTYAPHPPIPALSAANTDEVEASAERKRRREQLCALRFSMFLAFPSPANSFHSKTFGHVPNVPIFTHWDNR